MAMTPLGACVVIAAGACAGSPGRPQPPRTGAPSAVPRASERCYAGFVETVHDQRMPVQLRWRLDPEQRQLVEEWVDVRKTRTVYRVVLEGEEASAIAPNGDGGVLVGPPWAWTRFYTRGGRSSLRFQGSTVTGGMLNTTSLEMTEIECGVD